MSVTHDLQKAGGQKIYQTVSSILAVLRFLEVIFLGYRLQFGGEVRSRKG